MQLDCFLPRAKQKPLMVSQMCQVSRADVTVMGNVQNVWL